MDTIQLETIQQLQGYKQIVTAIVEKNAPIHQARTKPITLKVRAQGDLATFVRILL